MTKRSLLIFLFFLSSVNSIIAQEKTSKIIVVHGSVTDSENSPIKGAIIYFDSVKTRIRTNKKGYYKVKLLLTNKLLTVFSRKHGMLNRNYSGEQIVNLVFPKNHEVITLKKMEQLGFKVSAEKSSQQGKEYDQYIDIYQLLKDKFPSVQVYGQNISIRGASTLLGSHTPLFVVNGAIVGSLSSISPADIKSIDVLKGTSTALYGARGANGVIKIILK